MQALWLLHRSRPDCARLGEQGPPDRELVRLRSTASLAFPPGDIESFESPPDAIPPHRMTVTFMGLYGAHSPLPSFYAEEILRRDDEGDDAVRDFLDIFNHRLLSLLYRGLLKYRAHLLFASDGADEVSWRVFALAGLAPTDAPALGGLPAQRLLRFAGLLSLKPRSASAVAAVLATYFAGFSVRIRQCVPRWVYLDQARRSHLGRQACRLGADATIGRRVPDVSGKFRVVIGPVDFDTYCCFLPGRDDARDVCRLARLAAGDWLDFDTEVILQGADTPRLGTTLAGSSQLGWTTGLFSKPGDDLSVIFAGTE